MIKQHTKTIEFAIVRITGIIEDNSLTASKQQSQEDKVQGNVAITSSRTTQINLSPLPGSTAITARGYQLEALAAIEAADKEGTKRLLIALPTGTGKTIIFAQLIRRRSGRTLVIAHRDELIEQAIEKILIIDPQADFGRIKGKANNLNAQIVVASIQTLTKRKRLEQIDKDFQTIIIDEAHHAVAKSYRRVLRYLGVFGNNAGPLTVGFTATPQRGDGVALKPIFQKIVYSKSILEMIAGKYLSDLSGLQIELPVDFNRLAVRKGDFIESEINQLLQEIDTPSYIREAVKKHATERKSLIFVPGVELADKVAADLQANGIKAEAVNGKLSLTERRAILERLKSGETRVVVNCALLTEGFDEPSIDCIVLARPTRSSSLYTQIIGRGTRLHPGKTDCLIIDMVGATNRHDLMTLPSLFGLPLQKLARKTVLQAVIELETEREQERLQAQAQAQAIRKSREEQRRGQPNKNAYYSEPARKTSYREQTQKINFHWIRVSPSRFALTTGIGLIILNQQPDGLWQAYLQHQDRSIRMLATGIPVHYAQGIAEDFARNNQPVYFLDSSAAWRRQPASEKQITLIKNFGQKVWDGITKGEASDIIAVLFARD